MLCGNHTLTRSSEKAPKGDLPSGTEPRGGKGQPQNGDLDAPWGKALLLGKRDLHGIVLRDLKALQGISCCPSLHFVVKLHKGNVVPPRDQTHLLEAREPGRREEQTSETPLSIPLKFGTNKMTEFRGAKLPIMHSTDPIPKDYLDTRQAKPLL